MLVRAVGKATFPSQRTGQTFGANDRKKSLPTYPGFGYKSGYDGQTHQGSRTSRIMDPGGYI